MSQLPAQRFTDQWLRARLAGAREGLPEALGELLERCRPYLLLIANKELDASLAARGGASDIVQETFLDAQRDFERFRGDDAASLLAWLKRILEFNLTDFARRHRRAGRRADLDLPLGQHAEGVPDPRTPADEQVAADEEVRLIEKGIAALPEEYGRVLLLRHREDHTFAEIGRLTGRSPEAARKLWFRALSRLRRQVEEQGIGV